MAATLEALRGRLGQTSELDAAAALTQQAKDNLATLNGAIAEMLQHGAARESKLAEISRIHGAILGVTVPLIDDVYFDQIGRAHVWTPVTNAHLVCRLLLEKKNANNIELRRNNQEI